MIELKYWGGLMVIVGKKSETIDAGTEDDVLNYIKTQYGKAAQREAKRMLIVVNGTNIQLLNRYKTKLSASDQVAFLPLSAGG